MAELQTWSPLGDEYSFTPQRRVRDLGVNWDDAPAVSFAPHLFVSDKTGPRTQRVAPVIPFVQASGTLGLMRVTANSFGLKEEDLLKPESKSTTEDEEPADLEDEEVPWNEQLLAGEPVSLFRVLHTHNYESSKPLKPRGLYNTRNMCFFNSVMQVLVHTQPLCALVNDIIESTPLSTPSGEPPMRVLVALARFFYQYGDTRIPKAISGEDLYNVICTQPRFHVERDRQEDAQEFMSDLIDCLETSFREAPPTEEDIRDNLLDAKRAVREQKFEEETTSGWNEVGAHNKIVETQLAGRQDLENPIDELFGGRLRSTLIKPGSKPSVTMEPFQQIMLDISDPGVRSVHTAIENLLQEEHLMLDTAHATKRTQFDRLPPVLVVQIKRFTFMLQNGDFEMGKITKPILVDEVLQLNSVGGKDTVKYRPTGVIYHHGTSATRGHYTADVNVGGQWYKIDDEQVVPVDANEVVGFDSVNGGGSRSAYMVFYEKI